MPSDTPRRPVGESLLAQILAAIRGRSRSLPLKKLKREGHRTLTVLSVRALDDAIAKAVEIAIQAYGLPLDPNTLRGLSSDAKIAFARLIEERDSLKQVSLDLEKERETLARSEGLLRAEVDRARIAVDAEKSSALRASTFEKSAVEGKLREALRYHLEEHLQRLESDATERTVSEMKAFGDEIVGHALRALAESSEALLKDVRRRHDDRIAHLERRLAKLQSSLAETEALLARSRAESAGEAGLPSIYREAQGLDKTDTRYERKKHLLQEIFNLNVELRRLMDDPPEKK